MKDSVLLNLQSIPGVGKKISEDLWNIGIRSIQDLKGRNPESLYKKLCEFKSTKIDRCMLYVFRCAVYYASNTEHNPLLLKWWNWKDEKTMEYKAKFECEGKVKEKDGKKYFQMPVSPEFQGHTFMVDIIRPDKYERKGGSFRVEFVLCSEFFIHYSASELENVDFDQGVSNLRIGPSLKKEEKKLTIESQYSVDGGSKKIAALTFKTDENDYIQRLIIQVPEETINKAVLHSVELISSILDVVSINKQTPLQIRHIEVYDSESGDYLRRYMTIPYINDKYLDNRDFLLLNRTPKLLKPMLRLYREAINSSNPHYRLLCLYRINEKLNDLKAKNCKEIIAKGKKPKRKRFLIPRNELTLQFFPDFIGKSLNKFIGYVNKEYRINIAHLNWDNFFRLILDPTKVKILHEVDATNAVLEGMTRQSIEDELRLMQEHKLA